MSDAERAGRSRMRRLPSISRASWLILLLPVIVGCGPGNPLGRQAVGGKVTLDGAPLDNGTISFSPESGAGVSSGTVVKDGRYSIDAAKGLPPGKYLVRINATVLDSADPGRKTGVASLMQAGMPGIERIAPTYNWQSKIVVEVVGGKQSKFDFDTKSPQKSTPETPTSSKPGN